MKDLSKLFSPKEIEEKLYKYWEENGFFHAEEDSEKEAYTIVIPPPNVTGVLHMGHGLNNTLQDILIRYKRMEGYATLWMPGTDHAGIATQHVVEKRLQSEGTSRHNIGREAFLKRTWEVKNEHHATITKQLKKIGCSLDWRRERFTLDEGLSEAVKEVFVSLYEEKLIYRGKYIINYCPVCRTALANDEVEYEEKDGAFYHIKYYFKNSDEYLTIATTRPETMLGDTAVAINPSDERYKDVTADTLILPLVNREIPLIRDSYVSLETGTGALKVTPAHDPNDYALAQTHNLEIINILNEDATMNENVPEKYRGLDRFECRKRVIEDLEKEGFFVEKKEHKHQVGVCYRCSTIIEPYYSDQWFVKMKPLAEKALKAVDDKKIKIHPERWEKTYRHWMEDIRDWCISRQLWWGHRIPVWYCDECGEIICVKETPNECPKCSNKMLRQDEDVLDTWFSSWLWPFSTLGWPNKTNDLEYFYPTSTLITGFDILFFWVARMIMAGLHFMKEVPFKDVFLHGLVRDKFGRKMSKSLGNGIDPIDVINEYGADSFRFTLAFLTSLGGDVLLDKEMFKIGFKFANKIWNSARFIFSNLKDDFEETTDYDEKGRWIISRMEECVKKSREALDTYRFDEASAVLHKFFWSEFCDWYIEIAKADLHSDNKNSYNKTMSVLLKVLKTSLKLLHPIMPFITEEIWQTLVPNSSIMKEDYPKYNDLMRDSSAEKKFSLLQDIVQAIRNAYASFTISSGTKLSVKIRYENSLYEEVINTYENDIIALSRAASITLDKDGTREDGVYTKVLEGGEVNIPLKGVVDMDAEKERLTNEKASLEKMLSQSRAKLSNENFVKRAKVEAVEKEKSKEKEFAEKIGRITDILSSI